MPSNRTSNDIDPVQPTQYKVPPSRVAKKPPPKPWELPDFEPLRIGDFGDHGTPNLPPTLDRHDPFAIFSQFFTSEIIDKLVEWTNKYAELHPSNDAGEQPWEGLDMAVVYAKHHSTERMIASYLISSDLTPKNKLYRCICLRTGQYN